MITAAARRIGGLLLLLIVGTVAIALPLGLAAGSSVRRSISVGFYLAGCFLLIAGFFVGNRGPVRAKGDAGVPIFGPLFQTRMLRKATKEEREESINLSVVFVTLGFVLILLGILADTRTELF
jgi:hypothetical protein